MISVVWMAGSPTSSGNVLQQPLSIFLYLLAVHHNSKQAMSYPYENSLSCTLALSDISNQPWTITFLVTFWFSMVLFVSQSFFIPLQSIFHKICSGSSHLIIYRKSSLTHLCAHIASGVYCVHTTFHSSVKGRFVCLLCSREYKLLEGTRNILFNSEPPGLSSVLISSH